MENISAYESAMLELQPNAESSNPNGVDSQEMLLIYELESQYMMLVALTSLKCLDETELQLEKKII